MEKLKELPGWFTSHPFTKKIIAEEEKGTAAKRAAAIKEMGRLEEEFLKERAALEALILTTGEAAAAARVALDASLREFGQAMNRKHLLSVEFDRLQRAQKAILLQSYPEEVDDFLREMPNKLAEILKTFRFAKRQGEDHFFLDDEPTIHASNADSIQVAGDFIRSAIDEAEAMKLSALTEGEILARLAELRAGIPGTEEQTEREIPKPEFSPEALQRGPEIRPKVHWYNGELQPVNGWK